MNLKKYWTCLRSDLNRWEENHPITTVGQEAKSRLEAMIEIGVRLESMSTWHLPRQGYALLQHTKKFQEWLETMHEAHAKDLEPLVQVYLLHLDRYAQGHVVSNQWILHQGSKVHQEEAERRSQRLKQLQQGHRLEGSPLAQPDASHHEAAATQPKDHNTESHSFGSPRSKFVR